MADKPELPCTVANSSEGTAPDTAEGSCMEVGGEGLLPWVGGLVMVVRASIVLAVLLPFSNTKPAAAEAPRL